MEISNRIVDIISQRGGWFLKKSTSGDVWEPVPAKKAQTKTSQALREGLDVWHKTIRPEMMPRQLRRPGEEDEEDEDSAGYEEASPSRKRPKAVRGEVVVHAEMPSHPYLLASRAGSDADSGSVGEETVPVCLNGRRNKEKKARFTQHLNNDNKQV